MARPKSTTPPSYRLHRGSGQAVVTINGRECYLGKHGTPESHVAYDQLISAWLANARRLPVATIPSVTPTTPTGITVVEIVSMYQAWSVSEYGDERPNGEHASTMDAVAPVVRLFGRLEASKFGPNALREVRQLFVDGKHRLAKSGSPTPKPLSRGSINTKVHRIRRIFRWAVSRELIPAPVIHALETVEPLRAGRGNIPDKRVVRPVSEDIVYRTLQHLHWPVSEMVKLQLISGCRSGELVIMRGCDLDMSGKVWIYRPAKHKTARLGHERLIYLGPQAQRTLRPFLSSDLTAYLFSPAAGQSARFQRMRAARKTRVQPSQRNRKKRHPLNLPGDRYTPDSYRRAITRACEVAGVEPWHPHQLRHTAATRLRREYGVDVARVILGHSGLDATEIYAEADQQKAVEVMSKLG